MRIALDATYSLDEALSGVGVYSREILNGLTGTGFAQGWDWFYRWRSYWQARRIAHPANVTTQLLTESLGSRSASLFHGLNQRLPKRRFKLQIATFHDLFVLSGEYSTPEFRSRFAAQARHAAAAADMIIAVSRFTASQVESYLRVPASRIRVIHHGVVPRPAPQTVSRRNVVLCVGAIQRRKNQAALVRAFRALPADWTLVLAGSDGFEAGETLREIENSACRNRIQVTGYISDAQISEWYARARIFAFPSLDEGFGMPVLEAMAAGVPVIAGNRSALQEVAGDAALLVDPENDLELEGALERLATSEAERDTLIQKGTAHAESYTWGKAISQTLDLYRELVRR